MDGRQWQRKGALVDCLRYGWRKVCSKMKRMLVGAGAIATVAVILRTSRLNRKWSTNGDVVRVVCHYGGIYLVGLSSSCVSLEWNKRELETVYLSIFMIILT